MKKSVKLNFIIAGILSVLAVSVHAQGLPDPTRPATFQQPETAPATEGELKLQSVLESKQRTVAVISGKTVIVGDKIGDATVVKISGWEVVLRNGGAMQTLRLYPNVDKKLTSSGLGANGDSRAQ